MKLLNNLKNCLNKRNPKPIEEWGSNNVRNSVQGFAAFIYLGKVHDLL